MHNILKSITYESVRQPAHALLRFAALALALLALASCATAPQHSDPVVSRAQARWDAVIAGQYDQAYAYYSPGFRSTMSPVDFTIDMRMKRVRWTKATYRDHSCEKQACTVHFDIEYEAVKPVPGVDKYDGKAVVDETWVLSSGEWWYVPKK